MNERSLWSIALGSLGFYVRNIPMLAVLAALSFGAPLLFAAATLVSYRAGGSGVTLVVMVILTIVLTYCGFFYFSMAITLAVSLDASAHRAGPWQVIRRIRPRLAGRVLGTGLLFTLVTQGWTLPGEIVGLFHQEVGLILKLGGLVVSFFMLVKYFFSTVIVVLEGSAYRAALRRSATLVSGLRWRVFGGLLVMLLALGAISAAAGLIVHVALRALGLTEGVFEVPWGFAVGLFSFLSLSFVCQVLLYYDIRVRKLESFTPETLRQAV